VNEIDMQYVWCREKEPDKGPHYHVALLVDGSKAQPAEFIIQRASSCWNDITGSEGVGLFDKYKEFEGIKISEQLLVARPFSTKGSDEFLQQKQEFEEKMQEVKKCGENLSKADSKGDVPRHVREFAASALPKPRK